ncbi:MAG: hypothetical protein JRJ49_08200 [Deltaproteobacteria bacterium]|nr:hypothetical protein [Deltaproteobacteria bacterium]
MNRTLLNLAIIKSNWEKNKKDYIDNFVPMVANLAIKKEYSKIQKNNLERFKDDFTKEYGLKIPINAFITILNRAVKKKIFKKNYGQYELTCKKKEKYDLSINSLNIERKFAKAISSIIKFSNDEKYKVEFEKEDIENALLSFLEEHDGDILFAAKDNSVLPNNVKPNKKLKYLVSSFVIFAEENEPDLFKLLFDISVGHALAGAILFPELNSFSGKLTNLNIYLDTALILSLIGYHDKFQEAAVKEFIKILTREKVNLFIFDITRYEIESILRGCQERLERGDYNIRKASKVLRYCHQNNINSSDVGQKIVSLDTILGEFGIITMQMTEPVGNKKFQIDEIELKNTIQERYKKNSFHCEINDSSIDRDVKVLSEVYKLRREVRPRNIKDCKELFVTSNASLAFAGKIYEDKKTDSSSTIPTCLTDIFVGTIIWLQSPQKTENLNMKKFIEVCYSAIQPSDELIKKYIQELEKLNKEDKITDDIYYLLRTDKAAFNLLNDKSMGDPEVFNSSSEEIIESIKKNIKLEETEKLNREKEKHKETKNELAKIKGDQEDNAEIIAKIISWSISIICAVLAGCGMFFSQFNGIFNNHPRWKYFISFLAFIFGLVSVITGFNIKGLKLKIEKHIKKKC